MNIVQTLNTPSGGSVTELTACKGLLFVLIGPSGAGKNTIMKSVIAAVDGLRQMPTATTRPIREDEQHGREHYFISPETFQAMVVKQAFVEYQEVDPGKFYGTPRQEIEEALNHQRQLLIADIEVNGAEKLKAAFPDNVISIFIQPPNFETLEERLHQRGGMSEEEIKTRLARAQREMIFADQCDHRVVNVDLAQSVQAVTQIVRAEAQQHNCL